jgi:hypothetical protein
MCLVEPTKTVWLASDDKTLSAWNVESRCLMAKTERLSGQVLCTVEVGGFLVAGNLLGAITAYDVEPKVRVHVLCSSFTSCVNRASYRLPLYCRMALKTMSYLLLLLSRLRRTKQCWP